MIMRYARFYRQMPSYFAMKTPIFRDGRERWARDACEWRRLISLAAEARFSRALNDTTPMSFISA